MSIGVSIFLVAVGAILTWGVNFTDTNGIDVNTIGVILMVIGLLGFLASMLFWGGLGYGGYRGGRRATYVDRDVVVDDDPVLLRRGRRVVTRREDHIV